MADTEMAEFLRVNGIGGVALEPLVEERLTRPAHSQRTAGDDFAEESVQVRLANWLARRDLRLLALARSGRSAAELALLGAAHPVGNSKVPGLAFPCMKRSQSLL